MKIFEKSRPNSHILKPDSIFPKNLLDNNFFCSKVFNTLGTEVNQKLDKNGTTKRSKIKDEWIICQMQSQFDKFF